MGLILFHAMKKLGLILFQKSGHLNIPCSLGGYKKRIERFQGIVISLVWASQLLLTTIIGKSTLSYILCWIQLNWIPNLSCLLMPLLTKLDSWWIRWFHLDRCKLALGENCRSWDSCFKRQEAVLTRKVPYTFLCLNLFRQFLGAHLKKYSSSCDAPLLAYMSPHALTLGTDRP